MRPSNPYLARLTAQLGSRYSDHYRRNALSTAREFLTVVGPPREGGYGREAVLAYLDRQVKKGLKEQSIMAELTRIRALFTANEWPWPLKNREVHLGLPQVEADAPTLSPTEVIALIRGERKTPGIPRTVIAMACIWGLRSEEIRRVLAAGCNGRVLTVQTAKGGRTRQHIIPPPLAEAMTFGATTVSYDWLHDQFDKLMQAHVRPSRPREGWHSCRRSVVTAFYKQKVLEQDIVKWLGWRVKESIAQKYNKPDPGDLDQQMYAKHVYLAAWVREEQG